jgi:hypothetical protein
MQAKVWAMDQVNTYLRETQFTVFTDHIHLETHSNHQDKTTNRLMKPFLKCNFAVIYKKEVKCRNTVSVCVDNPNNTDLLSQIT